MKKGTDEITLVAAKTKLWRTVALFCWPIFFLAFTVFIYAPFEIYLNNINEFSFGLGVFWWMPLGVGILVLGLLIGFGLLVNLVFKRIGSILYGGFIFAIALACYLQGNFLGLRLGVLDGIPVDWAKYSAYVLLNVLVWVGIIFAVLIAIYFLKSRTVKIFRIASFITVAMQVAALMVLLITTDYSTPVSKILVTDKGLFELSSEHNVIVFTLDAFDDKFFDRMLEDDPSYKEKFDGFTRFTNSVGSACSTRYSVSAILTGHYLLNEGATLAETQNIAYDKTDFFEVLSENNFRHDIYAGVYYLPSKLLLYDASNSLASRSAYRVWSYDFLFIKLYKLVMFKYAPDVFKPYFWLDGTEFDELLKPYSNQFRGKNDAFATLMRTSRFALNDEKSIFKYIHISGAHLPYTTDENANPIPTSQSNLSMALKGALTITLEYFQHMKDLGVYDQSTIILCADHGCPNHGEITNPVLLVKRAGDTGEMRFSDAPVCHTDFLATIMGDLGLNADHKYGKSVFEIQPGETRNRMFYQYYHEEADPSGKCRLIEYSVADDSNLRQSFRLTDREFTVDGNLIPHRINCEYCLSGAYDAEDPNAPGSETFKHTQRKH